MVKDQGVFLNQHGMDILGTCRWRCPCGVMSLASFMVVIDQYSLVENLHCILYTLHPRPWNFRRKECFRKWIEFQSTRLNVSDGRSFIKCCSTCTDSGKWKVLLLFCALHVLQWLWRVNVWVQSHNRAQVQCVLEFYFHEIKIIKIVIGEICVLGKT